MRINKRIQKSFAAAAVLIMSLVMLTGCSDEIWNIYNSYEMLTENESLEETSLYEGESEEDSFSEDYDTKGDSGTENSGVYDSDTTEADVHGDSLADDIYSDENADNISLELYVEESGRYTSKEEVALYIHTYGKLPSNFITKKEAQKLGWESREGNLWEVTDKMSIGGDRFGNYDEDLPIAKGRKYYECDINYEGGYRGSERIIFSNDGLIFYTNDHYETFEQLY